MVDASIQTKRMTIDEYMRLYETKGPFEIINGERVEKVAPGYPHIRIALALYTALILFLNDHPLGEAIQEAPFTFPDPENPNWVKGARIPDIMFISAERLAAFHAEFADEEIKVITIAPDLVIEIVSPNGSYGDVRQKVQLYLQDGVQQVWVIDPKTKSVTIRKGDHAQELSESDTLDGADILPGLSIKVAKLFKKSGEK